MTEIRWKRAERIISKKIIENFDEEYIPFIQGRAPRGKEGIDTIMTEPSQTENEAEDESSEKEENESIIPLKTRTEILLQRMKEMEEDS